MAIRNNLRKRARALMKNLRALYRASRHPGTPRATRILIALVVAYVLSPVDLIPDFIPVIGYLDDILVLSIGLYLAARFVPEDVWEACRSPDGATLPPS
jgi:uncharacterized membrane protein YkvA (DUF1232 family)